MNLKIAVIAENRKQFEHFLEYQVPEGEREKYIYATRVCLRGIRLFSFIKIGECVWRIGEYEDLLHEIHSNIINPDV